MINVSDNDGVTYQAQQ